MEQIRETKTKLEDTKAKLESETISAIQNAVNGGKEVTVPQSNIDFNGWIGTGYIIIDPLTGAGAYMISGGLAGSWYHCPAGTSGADTDDSLFCEILYWIYGSLKEPNNQLLFAYISGIAAATSTPVGRIIAATINLMIFAFNASDIFFNDEGTPQQKFCKLAYLTFMQAGTTLAGWLLKEYTLYSFIILGIDIVYLSLFSETVLNQYCSEL